MPEYRPTYRVYTRDSLDAGAWEESDRLICSSLVRGVAPTVSQASLVWNFGSITKRGDAINEYIDKLDLRGKFVRVEMPAAGVDWVGYVVREEYDLSAEEVYGDADEDQPWLPRKTRLVGGDQRFVAVGIEWFLTQQHITDAVYFGGARVQRHPGFNMGWGDARDVVYAERGNKDQDEADGPRFAKEKDSRSLWTGWDILQSLLRDHSPRDKTGNQGPCEWAVNFGARRFLDDLAPTLQVNGRTLWQALNALISPRRGLVWWIEYSVGLGKATLYVDSVATEDIDLPGGGQIAKASNPVELGDLIGESWKVRRLSLAFDETRRADMVRVRGALRRSVFSVGVAAGNLVTAWRDEDEIAYAAAASGESDYPSGTAERERRNDRFRQAQQFARVYSSFRIPNDWDGVSSNGAGAAAGDPEFAACPTINFGTTSILGGEPIAMPGLRLLTTLPIREGYDYANANNPTVRDPDNVDGEFQIPFAVVDADGYQTWRFAHNLNTLEEDSADNKASYRLLMAHGAPSVYVVSSNGLNHSIAKNHFNPTTAAPSRFAPEVDFESLVCTVCGEWDSYCEGTWPLENGPDVPASDPLRTVVVSIGDRARFDWLAKGTVYDVQDGDLKTVQTAGALRDDRGLCHDLAKMAHSWYATPRAQVQISIDGFDVYNLGALLTSVGSANSETFTEINATVTQISYSPEDGRMEVSAGYQELDFAGFVV